MRIHFIDAMRSVLMVLGVVLHAANVYTVSGRWELHDSAATNPLFDGIVAVISSFRMPAFFVIAGFFAQMTLERHGRKYFLRHRLRRLAIPFLATALLLNSLQLWLQCRLPAAGSGGKFAALSRQRGGNLHKRSLAAAPVVSG